MPNMNVEAICTEAPILKNLLKLDDNGSQPLVRDEAIKKFHSCIILYSSLPD